MSDALRSLLSDYAEQARPYDVRAGALATAKRRRARKRVTPVLALIVVLALTGIVSLGFRGPGSAELIPVNPDRITIAGFPTLITREPNAPELPATGMVGEGVTVYHIPTAAGYGWYLVTADGSQYHLDAKLPTAVRYELSPDRRWLITQPPGEPTHTLVRDLTQPDTVIHDFPGEVLAWSPGGRWMVMGNGDQNDPGVVRVVDLRAPTEPPAPVDLSSMSGMWVSGLLTDGRIVLAPWRADGNLRLSIFDRQTGAITEEIQVDLAGYATDGQPQPDGSIGRRFIGPDPDDLVFTDDNQVLVQTYEHGETVNNTMPMDPKDVLVIDLATRKVTDVWVLPTPKVAPGTSLCSVDCWRLMEMLPEGALMEHRTKGGVTSWELYHPATKELFLVTDLDDISATGK